jgi:predicted Zn-dependent protease
VSIRYGSLFVLSTSILAQFTGHAVVRGELQIEGVDLGHDYQVDLADCSGGAAALRGLLSGGTQFEFDDVEAGCKTLRVLAGPQRTVIQEVQLIADGAGIPVVIRIANPVKEPAKGGIVSVDRLRHPVPPKAIKALAESNHLWQAGRVAEAGDKLRAAVDQFPDLWELHLNLGVAEMKLGNVAAAARQFSRVRELEPHSEVAAVGSGFALLQLHRLTEAENAAKDAVALDPRNKIARVLLARIQMEESHTVDQRAASALP